MNKVYLPGEAKQAYRQHNAWDRAREVQLAEEFLRDRRQSAHPKTGGQLSGACLICTPR